jgi:hypothetical protein
MFFKTEDLLIALQHVNELMIVNENQAVDQMMSLSSDQLKDNMRLMTEEMNEENKHDIAWWMSIYGKALEKKETQEWMSRFNELRQLYGSVTPLPLR